jgi:hypothetical protein
MARFANHKNSTSSNIDGIIGLVATIREKANKHILKGLKEQGIDDIVPAYGAVFVQLFMEPELTMGDIARRIDRADQIHSHRPCDETRRPGVPGGGERFIGRPCNKGEAHGERENPRKELLGSLPQPARKDLPGLFRRRKEDPGQSVDEGTEQSLKPCSACSAVYRFSRFTNFVKT